MTPWTPPLESATPRLHVTDTGLPDPVIINHHIRAEGGQIVELTCRLVKEKPKS
jgi:hypothetical protein